MPQQIAEPVRFGTYPRAVAAEEVKTITLVSDDVVAARRAIAGCALYRDLRVLAFDERRGRRTTRIDVTVTGHPRRIREFHDDVRGDGWSDASPDPLGAMATALIVAALRALRRRWQGRHDPPLDAEVDAVTLRTTVYWRWEEGQGGEAVGPVWVDTYEDGRRVSSEQWPDRSRRSVALAYAREHGFAFFPDE